MCLTRMMWRAALLLPSLLLLQPATASETTALIESGLSLTAAAPRPSQNSTIFNVKDCCVAVGNGVQSDTAAIAKAFKLARTAGSGVVLLPGPGVDLSGKYPGKRASRR